ncbi:GATOR complex protein WDR24-like isoform X1 [Ostrea edulis]|uniref:GATOR complex protein WDR24-like isoform X1 n=1 Tax=Ostrea edulis TaxID=37623 RepID=UPI0024AF801E|nr:GATOR complex protein WDR24-like isoform X1 [Ostrea edulis]
MNVMHNVSRVVHDKVSPNPLQTIRVNCEGAINALDTSKDNSQVVVAGRNVFKIYNIEEEKFEEKLNLRVGKNLNLNYSSTDVAWNHIEDHYLASAATNGSVVLWDLNRHSHSKQEFVFSGQHTRTVNRVRFHENDAHLLLSGSQDGSMHIFDLRKHASSTVFKSGNSIRDVQWCPPRFNDFFFAAADESGNVHMWDMRRPDRPEKQITAAHNGPVFTVDWHPEERHLFATGGRDKTIKIWDFPKNQVVHQIHTLASVARIRWRPQRRHFIASCSFVVDFSVSVWDINRPYVPFASFDRHTDVATGIIWRRDDPHVIYSSSRDFYLYQHVFKDAKRPADELVPAGLDMSIHGDISYATLEKPDLTVKSGRFFTTTRKDVSKTEEFLAYKNSLMFTIANADKCLSMDYFVDCARNYQLCGAPLQEMCKHNSELAERYNNIQVAQSWSMLKVMFASSSEPKQLVGASTTARREAPQETSVTAIPTNEISNEDTDESSHTSDEEDYKKENLTNIARGQIIPEGWDILFAEGDQDIPYNNIDGLQEWTLQHEAFQPRHEIKDHGNPLDSIQNGHDSPTISANESENNTLSIPHPNNSSKEEEVLGLFRNTLELPEFRFADYVSRMLSHYAEQGDVQTSVCILIVLGPKYRPQIEPEIQENWFLSYLDLLARFQLWTTANKIIKLSHLPQVNMLNQQSTRIHVNCHRCNRPLQRVGWLCDRCKLVVNNCSLCHLPVKGLFIWCQGCSHGGHLSHMKEWFNLNKQCPTGCGHLCEFT